ncbi:MAG: AraC family transcriptional regulator [bacterium]|nr:AraC family transcriptional regulator [bacterium]
MDTQKPTTRKIYVARINKVIDYIRDNLDSDLSLETLAGVAAFSPFHFHRIFKAFTDENLNEYVNRQRLELAASYLKHNPERTITDIALSCGFSSSSNFARAFKKYFGVSASEFRGGISSKIRQTNSNDGKTQSNIGEEKPPENGYTPTVNDIINDSPSRRLEEMEVDIKQLPAYRVAYVRVMDGYNSEKIGPAFRKIVKWAKARDLMGPDTEIIGISLDDPDVTPADKCRYDACVTVPEAIKGEGDVGVYDIPAGKYAISKITGQYANIGKDIGPAWRSFYADWLPDSGYQPDDRPCFEMYVETKEECEAGIYVVDICIPIKPL